MEKTLGNFTIKTALFLVLFSLPIFGLEVLLRQPEHDAYALKRELIESTLSSNEVLILGNSLSWGGLNPKLLDEHCINVAAYNQSFYSDSKILEKYLPNAEKLHTVILPLSAESFFNLPDERAEQMYSAYWGIAPSSGKKKTEHYSAVMIYGLEHGIKKLFEPKENIADKGWGTSNDVYDENVQAAKNKLALYRENMRMENLKICALNLDHIVDLCRSRDLRLILYIPPYSPVYNKLLEDDIFQRETLAFIEKYCSENQLECYDFNNNELFPNECFRDFNHLNQTGAQRASTMMKNILLQVPARGMVKRVTFKPDE